MRWGFGRTRWRAAAVAGCLSAGLGSGLRLGAREQASACVPRSGAVPWVGLAGAWSCSCGHHARRSAPQL
jgi:hypothetical protein